MPLLEKKILNDLNKKNIISSKDYNKLLNSLKTITSTYAQLEKQIHKNEKKRTNK